MTRTLELILEALANLCSPIDRAEYRRVSAVLCDSRSSGTDTDTLVCLTALPTRSSSDSCPEFGMLLTRPCTHHESVLSIRTRLDVIYRDLSIRSQLHTILPCRTVRPLYRINSIRLHMST